jgi:hypothetical protein
MRKANNQPSIDEKRQLLGRTNVESLLYALDKRCLEPISITLIGRASYEIGDEKFMTEMRSLLGEMERKSEVSGRIIITEDVDVYYTDDVQPCVEMAHKESYLARMAECYLHALTDKTLVLPLGWENRIETVHMGLPLVNLKVHRLNALDFIICKGAAGRTKDISFLKAFCAVKGITEEQVRCKTLEVLNDPPQKLLEDQVSKFNVSVLATQLNLPTKTMDQGPEMSF